MWSLGCDLQQGSRRTAGYKIKESGYGDEESDKTMNVSQWNLGR